MKSKINKTTFICLTLIISISAMLTSCGGGQKKKKDGEISGNISLSGAFALYPLAVKWAEEFQILYPEVHVDISAGGAGKGMTDALANVVDFGMVSREIYAPEIEKGAVPFAVAKDAVVPTINAENPFLKELLVKGLSQEAAYKIWVSGEYTTWGDLLGTNEKTPIHIYTRSDACGAAETFAQWMGKKQEDLNGTAVFGDPGLAAAIQRDKLGIGLNNISYAYDESTRKPNTGLLVLPVDGNSNGQIDSTEYFYDTKDEFISAVAENKYPSPPARDLYLVSNGVPKDPAVVAFLEFILTKGQQYNIPTGYISLSEEKLSQGLAKLHEANQKSGEEIVSVAKE